MDREIKRMENLHRIESNSYTMIDDYRRKSNWVVDSDRISMNGKGIMKMNEN